ncbi:MAG: Gfo/Idh/MocA family oxidoreductase [Armatimonadetes bacterium]|nr:Gfo/Idh/MocA family oxidoreductase [Armatimonadota bacterium]
MPVRVAILSTAHMHSFGYAHGLLGNSKCEFVGVWDDDLRRGAEFASRFGVPFFADLPEVLEKIDAVVITSENKRHVELAKAAAEKGKHILCEKPLVTTEEEGEAMAAATSGVKVMTAFPCRFSPAYTRLKERIANGDIGNILAINATNHGTCPFGWFVEEGKSGGGAMMDHTVHVADLLCDLLREEPAEVYAQTANLLHGQSWEDTAMLHVKFPSGIFATIDASWSRPNSYKTWGDVKMSVIGDKGAMDLDMFAQAFDVYSNNAMRGSVASYASDLDSALVAAFIKCIDEDSYPPVSLDDGLKAARFAMAGYRSAAMGEPVPYLP